MTREEAISMLEQIGRHECIWMVCRHNEVYDAIDIAIEALKEQKPHREWGKWIISEVRCPECLEYFDPEGYSKEEMDKCPNPNCGADMREGEAK